MILDRVCQLTRLFEKQIDPRQDIHANIRGWYPKTDFPVEGWMGLEMERMSLPSTRRDVLPMYAPRCEDQPMDEIIVLPCKSEYF